MTGTGHVQPKPLRVLVVDDSDSDAELVVRETKRGGYAATWRRVEEASDMRAALEREPWDLIISDWSMPRFTALGAIAVARELCPDLPLIIVSGTVGEDAVVAALHAGARDFVGKDKLTRLVPAIDRELREREIDRARRRAENTLEKTEQHLRQVQKMDAIGSLAGGVAHDFNNLLSIILGYSSLLLGDPALQAAHNDLEEIKHAGERAADLTRQLLAYGRRQDVEPDVVDLHTIVQRMERMIRRLIGEDVTLVIDPADGLGKVKVDPGQIEQVIMNLVVNARDAMPGGGTLTIATAKADDGADGDGPGVVLSVSDTGSGMDERTKAQAFEPFFTTKPTGKGTGLGLSTVFGIVKQTGGRIAIESALGIGTTVTVRLPTTADARASRLPGEPSSDLRGKETILLAEDDAQVRVLVRTLLTRRGYRVLEAVHGADALRVAADEPGRIDLLVTDVVMPELGGQELASRLLATRPGLRVLFMSGYSDEAIANHGAIGDAPFIAKPLRPDLLLRTLREVLER